MPARIRDEEWTKVWDAIQQAGGCVQGSSRLVVKLIRQNPEGKITTVSLDLSKEEKSAVQSLYCVTKTPFLFQRSFHEKAANKAPEPTTMAVTPRAIARIFEMKPRTPNRHAARGAPATVVAHL